jgi:hypothetical protein
LSRGPEIGFGDLLRVLHALAPEAAEDVRDVHHLLGISLPVKVSAREGEAVVASGGPSRDDKLPQELPTPAPLPATPAPEVMDASPPLPRPTHEDIPFDLRPLTTDESPRPGPPVGEAPVDLHPPGERSFGATATSLFNPWWQRAILSTALSTWETEGELDVAPLIEVMAAARPLLRVPQRMVGTLRRGVQVLLDVSSDSLPFFSDFLEMEKLIRDVVGSDAARVLRFWRTPWSGVGPRGRSTWRPYQLPTGGSPVLVLSTLGLYEDGRVEAPISEWVSFAAHVQAGGSALIAFVPVPARAWPEQLSRAVRLIGWDRATTVRDVRPPVLQRRK